MAVVPHPPGFFAACCGGLAGRSKAQICALELRPPGCCGGRRFLRRSAKPPHRIPVGVLEYRSTSTVVRESELYELVL
jgi:hypothetical protein